MARRGHRSFDEIIAQTSLIGAYEKNKIANFHLGNSVRDINGQYRNSLTKIDEQAILNRQIVYNIKNELKKGKEKEKEDESRRSSFGKLPELSTQSYLTNFSVNTNGTNVHSMSESPIPLFNMNTVKNDNSFLPYLMKNLENQKKYGNRNMKDLVEYSLTHRASPLFDQSSHTPSPTPMQIAAANKALLKTERDKAASEMAFQRVDKKINSTEIRPYEPKRRQLHSEVGLMNEKIQEKLRMLFKRNRPEADQLKSIRRGRLNPHEFNEYFDYKMNLMRVLKKYDRSYSICTRKCEFKHQTRCETDFGEYADTDYFLY